MPVQLQSAVLANKDAIVREKLSAAKSKTKIDKFAKQDPQLDNAGAKGGAVQHAGNPQNTVILQVIKELKDTQEGKMGELKVDLALICRDTCNTKHRVTKSGTRVSEMEDTVKLHEIHLETLQRQVNQLEACLEDVEGRSHRKNLCIVGIPEGLEEFSPTSFITNWLTSWVPESDLSKCFVVEQAHCALMAKPLVGAPTQPFIP
ncbi:hypothetical protein NDU88_004314 [Pleurodeles waltl]|uniref:Uncharacterized protein n=1 Tax=Pleurodeles waltl TaxID=8319 RepID=A0AAV7MU70_PLEWA|nr:hypothetical protein NDU88_004314 [Pleurodeles waltl]